MRDKILSVALLAMVTVSFAQQKNSFWKTTTQANKPQLESRLQLPTRVLFDLDVNALKASLVNSPKRGTNMRGSNVVLSLPNANGEMEAFRVFENSNMDPALALRYPNIKSYIGVGVDNPTLRAFFQCVSTWL